ncbi:hypothetical protein SUDANB6_03419 [Streptomyces sp. enrichment culture]|uniref:DUF4352 domain-containing protein n=1 Tax=Streptomyces sp. enrichment culture TaxID=1795815 RepID=UPI003F54C9B6
MNQQYPQQPQQPPHPHTNPQQPYPPQPGWGGPQQQSVYGLPPQPPKKRGVGKVVGIGCAGLLALLVVIAVVAGGGDSGDSGGKDETAVADGKQETGGGTKEEPAREEGDSGPAEGAQAQGPVEVTARKTAFAKTILADGTDYTSVLVTVTNNGGEQVDVNPLYFTITDTDGTKHTAELAVDENQIDTVKLASGENVSGTVTGKGTFTPKYVTFTDGLFGDPVRVDVS